VDSIDSSGREFSIRKGSSFYKFKTDHLI